MGLSIVGGFALGCVLYWLPPLRRTVDPFLAAYYSLPHFAFYPLLIVIFGLGALPLIVLATLFAMVAMIMATLTGLDRIPRVLIKTARMQRLSLPAEIWHIRLPAAAPHLFSGLKLAVTYSFIGVIAGEFILSTSGLGHEIAFAYDNFDNRDDVRADPVRALHRHRLQPAGLRLRAAAGTAARPVTAVRSLRGPLLLTVTLLVAWQVLHQWAGDTALTAPLPTLEHLWEMIGQKRFLPHLSETGLAFLQALAIACDRRRRHRRAAGRPSSCRARSPSRSWSASTRCPRSRSIR